MQLEISDDVAMALQQRAAAAGLNLDTYLRSKMQEDEPAPAREALTSVDAWIDHLRRSGSSSGRDGRPWREFIHEGHRR